MIKVSRTSVETDNDLNTQKPLSVISILAVIITIIFTVIVLKQRQRENQNALLIKDLSLERNDLIRDITEQQDKLTQLNAELGQLNKQKALIDLNNKLNRTDQQISILASRLRKGTSSPLSSMKVLNNIPQDLRGWEWGYLYLKSLPDYQPLIGHREQIVSIKLSPDQSMLITASWDDTANIWDANNGKLLQSFKHESKGVSDVEYAIFSETILKLLQRPQMALSEFGQSTLQNLRNRP